MSVHIARASDRKLLASMLSLSSWRAPSNSNNEFLAHIPVGDRVFSTYTTEGTSARSGLEKAVSEQGGIVLTCFDARYNAHEIVGVWLPDGFSYCSGDQKKVAAALNQSSIALDSTIGFDLLKESSLSEGRGSMHFYLGKEGIPFTRDTNGDLQFFNADEFTFTKNRSVISWANTNSAFDPQTISDFSQKYADQNGVIISSQAQKQLELAHGGNRVSGVLLDTTIALVIKPSNGEITSANEYNIALDFVQIQLSAEFVAATTPVSPIQPQITSVQFSYGVNSVSLGVSPQIQQPFDQKLDSVLRAFSQFIVQNDNATRSKAESSSPAIPANLLFVDAVRSIQRQQMLSANDNQQNRSLDSALQVTSRLAEAKSKSESSQPTPFQIPIFSFDRLSNLERRQPLVANAFQTTKRVFGLSHEVLNPSNNGILQNLPQKLSRNKGSTSGLHSVRTKKAKNSKAVKPNHLPSVEKKESTKKSKSSLVKISNQVSVPKNRKVSKIPKKQFSAFKVEPEKLAKKSKAKSKVRNTRLINSPANDNAVLGNLSKPKTKIKLSKTNNIIDLAKYRSRKQYKPEQSKIAKVKGQKALKSVIPNHGSQKQVSKVIPFNAERRKSKNNKKNKKKIPDAFFRELIGLFHTRRYQKRLVSGIVQAGS